MTPELYHRLNQLFDAAVALPIEKRPAFVNEACAGDPELRRHLEALLAAHDESTGTLDAPLLNLRDLYPAKQRTLADGELILGRFKIVRLLGMGGMGEVYEAEDRFLQGVNVALKTILPNVADDPDLQKRFVREVLLAREVMHPNLCPVHTIFHCEDPPPGYLFLTMKLLPGQTLAVRLRQHPPLTGEEGLSVLCQTSLGLAAIHAAGIIHRDIKANNIMVDGRGPGLRLWITDFGLALAYQAESTVSTVGRVVGTPGYIAPELFLGQPPSEASDLFAFGVVLHEVFAGQKPIPVPGTHSYTVSPRLAAPKVPLLGVRLVTECLQDDPIRRCTAFAEALKIIDPKLDRSQYTGRTRQFWTRRRFAATAAAGVCAVAGSAWWKWDELENALHPLPSKRFVALLNWPKSVDAQLTPMLSGALTAIKNELSRFEFVDRDLFVISPEDVGAQLAETSQLKDICALLGANLVLAASGLPDPSHFKVSLRLVDPLSGRSLRERTIETAVSAVTLLPQKAVEAATALLNLPRKLAASLASVGPGTQSAAAFTAFQSAENLAKEQNDSGLNGAIEKYKQAVDLDPRYAAAYAKLGTAYCRLASVTHDPAALALARRNSEASLALNPNLVDGHAAMAAVLQQTGDNQGAFKEFSRALALDPSDPRTLVWQAQLYTKLNRWQDAERTLRRVLALRPNYWIAYNELGVALNSEGKYSDAIDQFRAACIAAPRGSMAFSNLGTVYMQLGHFAEAIEYLKKSLSLKPNALAASNISAALRAEGKPTEALPFAQKATDLGPADDWNWLELGDCYSSLPGRHGAAKDAYERAASSVEQHLRTDPSDGPAWMQFALYQVKSGQQQNALSLIEKAESLGASDMDSQLSKARILESLGRREDALVTLKACFLRGATGFQVSSAPDMRSLQRDPRYQELLHITPGNKQAA
jgi:serine/threonine protein kinase/Tfp pilus assembly protein PilF